MLKSSFVNQFKEKEMKSLIEVKEIVKRIVQERFSEDDEIKIKIIEMYYDAAGWHVELSVSIKEKFKNIKLRISEIGDLHEFYEEDWNS